MNKRRDASESKEGAMTIILFALVMATFGLAAAALGLAAAAYIRERD